ncbi:hypothetical protein BpHYR1_027516 [Brachionus plicatilis]|uniref:Uncharacterized protein n=1 Tax=Brachionus plicatilis TaxID=10195 RepID=A0A3M7RZ41_BRAPC|nr:hypothetical protein BpHYR1_027516 [Brachionus plicatilis]
MEEYEGLLEALVQIEPKIQVASALNFVCQTCGTSILNLTFVADLMNFESRRVKWIEILLNFSLTQFGPILY